MRPYLNRFNQLCWVFFQFLGLFEHVLKMGIPTLPQRVDILTKCTQQMPLHPEVSLNRVARQSRGYVARDLRCLCDVAAMQAVGRSLASICNGDDSAKSSVTTLDFQVSNFANYMCPH